VPLESDAGRHFGELVDKFIASSCRDADMQARLTAQFVLWRDNGPKLQPLVQRSFLVKEVEPISQSLTVLGLWGLYALDLAAHGQAASDSTKMNELSTLENIKTPKAQLLLIPATGVQKLIEATAKAGACGSNTPSH
jgi:hypothetical protein